MAQDTITPSTIPPPPDPTDAQLKRTTGDKIGGFLGAISRPGSVLGTISEGFEKAHQQRLGKAKMYHDVMVEKLARANDPSVGADERAQAQAAYDAAKTEYLKLAPDPETKKNMQMRTAIAEHHVRSQQPQGAAGATQQAGSMSPPPAPGAAAGGPAGAAATPPATPSMPTMTPPPSPPNLTDVMAGMPGEMQRDADARTLRMNEANQKIISDAKIREEQAKPVASKNTPASDAYFSLLDQTDPETGEKYTPQKALKIVTDASTKAGKKTPFEEYMSDPANYDKFKAAEADAKAKSGKSASISAVYAIYRMLEMGYKQNPDILPLVAQMAPQVFAQANMQIPPGMAAALGKVPLDQPLSPVTGSPIGTAMPGAPTGTTRTSAQSAARVEPIVTDLRQQIDDLKGYLGPGAGRVNIKYLLGMTGSTGDPDKDKALSGLRTNLELLSTLTAKFHISSVRAMQEIAKLADAGKDSAPALLGFIDQVEKRAKETEEQEQGAGEKKMTPPPSATTKFTDNGRTYNIPVGRVAAFKKDHPNAVAASTR